MSETKRVRFGRRGLVALAALAGLASQVQAQEAASATKVKFQTGDGVYLSANYFSPPGANKDTPVVVLVHEFGRDQRELFPFAEQLMKKSDPDANPSELEMAVLTFDLRGNGGSKEINASVYNAATDAETKGKAASRTSGRGNQISFDTDFRTGRDLDQIVNDFQAVKKFLLEENNRGKLNIKQLGVVACGPVSSQVALQFAQQEYDNDGRSGWLRQGGDLAALVLISPDWNVRGMKNVQQIGKSDNVKPPILIIASDAKRSEQAAARFGRTFRIAERTDEKNRTSSRNERPDSVWLKIKSPDAGADLLVKNAECQGMVEGFLLGRLVPGQDNGWAQREIEVLGAGGFGSSRGSQ
jgi:pimeloyl-ACP methyl ester carboxylesterase